jgi:hypothetical protein
MLSWIRICTYVIRIRVQDSRMNADPDPQHVVKYTASGGWLVSELAGLECGRWCRRRGRGTTGRTLRAARPSGPSYQVRANGPSLESS